MLGDAMILFFNQHQQCKVLCYNGAIIANGFFYISLVITLVQSYLLTMSQVQVLLFIFTLKFSVIDVLEYFYSVVPVLPGTYCTRKYFWVASY